MEETGLPLFIAHIKLANGEIRDVTLSELFACTRLTLKRATRHQLHELNTELRNQLYQKQLSYRDQSDPS